MQKKAQSYKIQFPKDIEETWYPQQTLPQLQTISDWIFHEKHPTHAQKRHHDDIMGDVSVKIEKSIRKPT